MTSLTAGVTGKTASEEESNLLDGVVGAVGEIAQFVLPAARDVLLIAPAVHGLHGHVELSGDLGHRPIEMLEYVFNVHAWEL